MSWELIRTLAPVLLVAASLPAQAQTKGQHSASLPEAISDFNSGKDDRAEQELKTFLGRDLAVKSAASAHLYLGLIKLNRLQDGLAKEEFIKALKLDPTIGLPFDASPKAQEPFQQAREALELQEKPAEPQLAPVPLAAEAMAPAPPAPTAVVVVASEEGRGSHWLALGLAGGAVAAAAVAVVGGVEVLSYDGMIDTSIKSPGTYNASQIGSAKSNAQVWAVGWIVCAVLAAAGATGSVLTW